MSENIDKIQKARGILNKYIKDSSSEYSPYYIAKQLKRIQNHDEKEFFSFVKRISKENLADILIELPDFILKDIMEALPSEELADVIEELESDDATDLWQNLEEIDEQKAKEVFENLEEQDKKEIELLRSYDENEAGAYMQAESFMAHLGETTAKAIERLKILKSKGELENVHQLFIVDKAKVLLYGISLEDLILTDFSLKLSEVVSKGEKGFYTPISANAHEPIEKIVHIFEEHDLSVLPIINDEGVLLGRITADDIHDIIQENATEQIYNLAGVDDEAEEEATLFEVGKSRAIWLFVNLITAIVASAVIAIFDTTIQAYVALAVLMPIVASMGGNTGTQALTVVVRKLALGEITFENAKEALFKEVIVALVNGFIFAIIMGVTAYLWFDNHLLGVVIGISMIVNLFFAGLFGALIPLGFKRLNFDPAVGSTVILTTITDVVGFFSFLGLAKLIIL